MIPNNIKMVESKEKQQCAFCDREIKKKTFHMVVANKVRFHIDCWEKKRVELRHRYGVY